MFRVLVVDDDNALRLTVSSAFMIEPRVGSTGLLAREKVPRALSVARTRFSRNALMTSAVQALKNEQKLSGVASVRPYDRV